MTTVLIYAGVVVWAYFLLEVCRRVMWVEATNHWLEAREAIFATIIRDMVALRGSNFIHRLPGEYETNYQTLRAMWASMQAQEEARALIFSEFTENFKVLEAFEIEHPPPEHTVLAVVVWRWLSRRCIFLSDRLFG